MPKMAVGAVPPCQVTSCRRARIPHRTGAGPFVLSIVLHGRRGRLPARRQPVLRPPRIVANEETSEIGPETPAVASLLTNGFVVTPNAAVATLFDLAARGWLRIVAARRRGDRAHRRPRRPGRRAHGLRAAGPQPPAPAHRRNGQRRDRCRHRDRRAAPGSPLVAALQRCRRRRRPAPGPLPAALEPLFLVVPAALARRSPAGSSGARCARATRRRSRSRCCRGPRRSSSAIAILIVAWRDRQAGAVAGSAADRRRACSAPRSGCRCGPGWSHAASKEHRASSPTTPAGRSATPPRSGSPNGLAPNFRSSPRTTARPGAMPPARGTSSRSATRSAPGSAAIQRSCWSPGSSSAPGSSCCSASCSTSPGATRSPSSSTTTSPTRRTSSTTSPSGLPPRSCCRCCGWSGSSSPERSTCSPRSNAAVSSCVPAARSG